MESHVTNVVTDFWRLETASKAQSTTYDKIDTPRSKFSSADGTIL